MKKRIIGFAVVAIIIALGLTIYLRKADEPYHIDHFDIAQENNPPSIGGVKPSKAITIAMKVIYQGEPKELTFPTTCQNADLTLKSHASQSVPVITYRVCGQAFSSRSLKSGDTIEAQEMFDMSGLESGDYTLIFTYKDVISFEKEINIK